MSAPNVDPDTGEVLEDPLPKPFSQFLLEQRFGALHGELSEKLQSATAASVEHQKVLADGFPAVFIGEPGA